MTPPAGRPDGNDGRTSRTSVEVDDGLAGEVMHRFGLATRQEAVELALRRLVGPPAAEPPASREFLLGLEGMGWDGDLDEMRRSRVDDQQVGSTR